MLDKTLNQLIHKCICILQEKETQETIQYKILDPIIQYILMKLNPYIIIMTVIFIMTFIMAIIILFIMLTSKQMPVISTV
jgi:hypothetical protein